MNEWCCFCCFYATVFDSAVLTLASNVGLLENAIKYSLFSLIKKELLRSLPTAPTYAGTR